jgi:DNA-binding transcriptional ArsR family regulator
MTPGGVSQHLTVLRDAGLVCGRRVARSVLYLRSAEGDALLDASGGAEPADEGAAPAATLVSGAAAP